MARIYLVHHLPIWYDEACSVKVIQYPFSEIISGIRDLVHPPGYYLVLKIWSVFSINLFWLRLLSAGSFLANCYLLYRIGCKNLDKHFSKILVFVYVYSGYFIIFDWQVRMYTPVVTLILLSLYFIRPKSSLKQLVLLTLVNAAGLYFDYAFIWYYFPLILLIFIESFTNHNFFKHSIALIVSLVLYFLIWSTNLLENLQTGIYRISWMYSYMKPGFWIPYFLGSHNQFLSTIIFLSLLFFGSVLIIVNFQKLTLFFRLFFISLSSLTFTLCLSIINIPLFHLRSLQIVGLTVVFIYAYTLYQLRKINPILFFVLILIFLANFWYHVLSIQSMPEQYLVGPFPSECLQL